MSLNEFHLKNIERQHEAFAPAHSITALVVCVQEEVGELAAAVLGVTGEKKRKAHLTNADVLDAVADAMTYLSLIAGAAGCTDLEKLLGDTFNMVSDRAKSRIRTRLGQDDPPFKDGDKFRITYADGSECPPEAVYVVLRIDGEDKHKERQAVLTLCRSYRLDGVKEETERTLRGMVNRMIHRVDMDRKAREAITDHPGEFQRILNHGRAAGLLGTITIPASPLPPGVVVLPATTAPGGVPKSWRISDPCVSCGYDPCACDQQ